MPDTSSQVDGRRLAGASRVEANPTGLFNEDMGTFMITRQGRYKSYGAGFSSRPSVFIGVNNPPTGTLIPVFMGTPNVGSFKSRIIAPGAGAGAGTYYATYHAIGPR